MSASNAPTAASRCECEWGDRDPLTCQAAGRCLSDSAARSRSKLWLRLLEAEFVCFLGLWLYLCTLGPVPWFAIIMWVPLFVVFAFVLGLGEAKS